MKRVSTVAAVLLSFVLVACGGGSGPEDEITAVTEQISTAETPAEIETACRELLSPAFVDEVYEGKVEKCIEKPVNNHDEEDDPGLNEVESVEVDGSSAAATIVTVGGDIPGSGGTWKFVEDEGDWQLDRIEDDYLRSTFEASIQTIDGGAFAFEPVRKCMGERISALDSASIRDLAFENLRGDRKRFLGAILDLSEKCPDAMDAYVADQIATGVVAERGATPAQVNCARRELKVLLDVTGLTSQSMDASIDPDPSKESVVGAALAGLVSGAMKRCPR